MAAGLGTRMRSAVPKLLHPVLGRRMVDWVLNAAVDAGADPVVVVASPQTRGDFDGLEVVVQEKPLGTGDAVRAARSTLEGSPADVLVLAGDAVLLTATDLGDLIAAHRAAGAAATVLGVEYPDARHYGRLVRGTEAGSSGSSRRATRRPPSSRSARPTPRSTCFAATRSGLPSNGSRRRTPRARST